LDDAVGEVRVGDVQPGEGDGVAGLLLQFAVPTLAIEASVGDDEAAEEGTQGLADIGQLLECRHVEVQAVGPFFLLLRLGQLHEADLQGAEFFEEVAVGVEGVEVGDVVESPHGGELDSDLERLQMLQGKLHELQQESASVSH